MTLPCFFKNCFVRYNKLSSLASHISRNHCRTGFDDATARNKSSSEIHLPINFTCLVCNAVLWTIEGLISHLRSHLKNHESIVCPYESCDFQTSHVKTFNCHISRSHSFTLPENVKQLYVRERVEASGYI